MGVTPRPASSVVAFGGSNTVGANATHTTARGATTWGRPLKSFARLSAMALSASFSAHAMGGMSPSSIMCARSQIPKDTVLGTVEFLPNIGFIHDDEAEVRAMRFLVRSIQEVGALAVVVNVVPGDARFERDAKYSKCGQLKTDEEEEAMIGCVDKERMGTIRQKIRAMAAQEGAPLVEMECQSTPELCGSDSFHMNQDGHQRIADQILKLCLLYTSPSPRD